MAVQHKVFVSYHHANDQAYRDAFERLFALHYAVIISGGGDVVD